MHKVKKSFSAAYHLINDVLMEWNPIGVIGAGTYDVCSGEINITYDIYYMDTDWIYWYTVTNVLSVP